MKRFFMMLPLMLLYCSVMAQNTFRAKVFNNQTKAPLKGATASIPDLQKSAAADTSGLITVPGIPNGKFEIEITYIGFAKSANVYTFPQKAPEQIIEIS